MPVPVMVVVLSGRLVGGKLVLLECRLVGRTLPRELALQSRMLLRRSRIW